MRGDKCIWIILLSFVFIFGGRLTVLQPAAADSPFLRWRSIQRNSGFLTLPWAHDWKRYRVVPRNGTIKGPATTPASSNAAMTRSMLPAVCIEPPEALLYQAVMPFLIR